MTKTDFKKRLTILVLIFGIFLTPVGLIQDTHVCADTMEETEEMDFEEVLNTYILDENVMLYKNYIKTFDQKRPDRSITINANEYIRYEENDKEVTPQVFNEYEEMSGESILTKENGYVEYTVDIPKSGLYDLSLLYYPIKGKNSEIQRSFFIDGKLPYKEASLIEFSRVWKVETSEKVMDKNGILVNNWPRDNQGNDLKPSQKEAPEWINTYLYDSDGYVTENLSFYFEKGKHNISIKSIREPMLIKSLTLSNGKKVLDYKAKKQEWDNNGASNTSGQTIRIEAESTSKTSSQMLYPQQDQSSSAIYPSSAKYLRNNSIGGYSWRFTGQWMEWEFDVPESGYYNLSLYAKQNFTRGFYVSRKIMIDGVVPFKELEDYPFVYKQNWRIDNLCDENGQPYNIYIEKGKHTLRMEVVLGDFSNIISQVEESVQKLNAIYRKVIRIIGVSPDQYRDYQIEKRLPLLEDELIDVRNELNSAITQMRNYTGKSSDKEAVLITMRDQLDELIKNQERFTKVIGAFKINVRATGNWITSAMQQPLQLDRIYITSPNTKAQVNKKSLFSKVGYETKRLFWSFVIDYNQIGNVANEQNKCETITLWIGSGRDQANVIKSLIDKTFSNKSGINVNVQLVDMNTLLRATLVDEGPDVAIQVANTNGIAGAVLNTGNDTPVNYGLRNAVIDLSQFNDFNEVRKRFAPSAMTAFEFNGASYALPETQTFPMMFYRKDILSELGLAIPQTWDDVKVAMTVLNKNQMEIGMFPSEQIFATLLYQKGGKYYNENGISSALDSDIAVSAFKEYCEYYTDYKLDYKYDLPTSVEERFRTGEAPIIIADYTTYNNFQVSAPDIKGLWDFTPVPGILKSDRTIDRSTSCTGLASIIMKKTKHKDACWEFLKWWTSAQTQTMFGREMESLMGSAARVPTANLEAFANLPWSVSEYNSLKEQFKWVKGIPQVPGGYYSWRNVNNAYYAVTTDENKDTASPREELMDQVISINAEINFKRQEFGLPVIDN